MIDKIEQTTLPNGLKVLCLPKPSAPVVAVQVWYATGSVNERPGVRGISHFFEHMMFRGSEHVASEEHARRINDVGGHANAFTADDITAYTNSVPREHLDMVLAMEADRMQHLRITGDILETERQVIIEEYHTYMNHPVSKVFLEFRREFFGGHPYAASPLGTIEDITRITVDECVDYYRTWYRPSSAVVVVVGDVGSAEQVFERAAARFGDISPPPAGTRVSADAAPPSAVPRRFDRHVDFDVPMQVYGYAAPKSSDPDAIVLDVLQQVLSHGETSRLTRSLVKEQGVAVFAGGANQFMRLAGMSLLFAAFTPDISHARVARALDREIARLQRDGVTDDEMEKVRNAMLAARTFEMYSAEQLCHHLGLSETVEGSYRSWVDRMELLRGLTREHLVEVARRYWDESRRWSLSLHPQHIKPLLYLVGVARRLLPRGLGG